MLRRARRPNGHGEKKCVRPANYQRWDLLLCFDRGIRPAARGDFRKISGAGHAAQLAAQHQQFD